MESMASPIVGLHYEASLIVRIANAESKTEQSPEIKIEIYRGSTGRRALNYRGSTASVAAEPGTISLPSPPKTTIGSGLEGSWLRN